MKPLHIILPVMAAAAIGVALPALAQQSSDGSAKAPVPPTPPAKTVEVTTTGVAKADGMPTIKINGAADQALQKVLHEALSFKGSDADFAKKAAVWKKEHGFTVVRKGPNHVLISSDAKGSALKVEVIKGEGASMSTSIARTDRAVKAGSPAEVRELRITGPAEKAADGSVRIEVRGEDIAKARSGAPTKEKAIEGIRIFKDGEGREFRVMDPKALKELEILKELPLMEGFKVFGDGENKVFRFEGRNLVEGKPMTEKDRASLRKEIQALRKQLRSLPKDGGMSFEMHPGHKLNEKELKELKGLQEGMLKGFKFEMPEIAGKMLSEKELKELKGLKDLKFEMPEIAGKMLAPMEGHAFVFGHAMIEGLSEADQKKMHEEIAKVHAETEKKIADITAKYKAKAKKPSK